MKKLLLIVALLLLASPAWATTYSDDFEGAAWAGVTPNDQQCANMTVGDFAYGWGTACTSNCCSTVIGSAWYYSTEQANSGSHAIKFKYPTNSVYSSSYPLPRITWPTSGSPALTEAYFGGRFYLASTFIAASHKFVDWRYTNGKSDNIILTGTALGAWMRIPINTPYPPGSPDQLKYYQLYLCNADGTRRYLSLGAWHSFQIFIAAEVSPNYTDTLKVWIDGEICKLRYGAAGSEIDTPSANVVDANITDYESLGDTFSHMSWCLNIGGTNASDDVVMWWDDIFVGSAPPGDPDPPGNVAPVLAGVGNKSVVATELLTFTVSATDADGGDVLTYSATGLPTGATFTAETATFSWTPTAEQGGTYAGVTFTVVDDGTPQGTDSEAITITVTAANQVPVLSAIGNKTVAEGAELAFTVEATDPDGGQTVTLSSTTLPEGAVFTVGTGAFAWTPTSTQSGSYELTFTATDDGTPALHTDEAITITVTNANGAPVLDAIGNKTIEELEWLKIQPTSTDPDGNPCTVTVENAPTGMAEGVTAGTWYWRPTLSQAGTYADIIFTVTDNGDPGLTDSETISITVSDFTPGESVAGGSVSNGGSFQ